VAGGIPFKEQMRALEAGIEIITCTPGKIRDLVSKNQIDLGHVRFYVLDEADNLVDKKSDSLKIVREMHSKMPRGSTDSNRLQMIVCSATLHNFGVSKLAEDFMHYPQWIDLKGQDSVPDTVHQVVCMVDPKVDKSWIRLRSTKTAGIKVGWLLNWLNFFFSD
jgi:ATP-dependent RNA helicase DDX1